MPKGAGIAITVSSPTTSAPSSARTSDGSFTSAPQTGSSVPVSTSEAIDNALAAGSADRAIRLVERAARPAFEAGELATLLGWLEALPPTGSRRARSSCPCRHGRCSRRARWGPPWRSPSVISPRRDARGPAEGRLLILQAMMATVTGPDAEDLAIEGLGLVGDDPLFRSFGLLAAGLANARSRGIRAGR